MVDGVKRVRLLAAWVAVAALAAGVVLPVWAGAGDPAHAAPSEVSLFTAADEPESASWPDGGSVELGVKFSADVAGQVTGVRFWKGAGNTGTHVGNLWSREGRRLASATFTGESTSGWQHVRFAAPVPVQAGAQYVASYFAPRGQYAVTPGFFSRQVVRAPLRTQGGTSAGVYAYASRSAFPTQSYRSSAYWVDVAFVPATGSRTAAPAPSHSHAPSSPPLPPVPLPTEIAYDYPGKIEFKVACNIDHYSKDDPIVFPGQPGRAHMHAFYSNPSADAFSTTESLAATPSTCINDMGEVDRSAYWVPSLVRKNADGTLTQYEGYSQNVVYYRRPAGPNGPQLRPIPRGLRMIAGDHAATGPSQPIWQVLWGCGQGGPVFHGIPTCSPGAPLHASLVFPSCWDGVHLDSADHKSHMAYARKDGSCPATHPVSLPMVTFEVDFPQHTGGPEWTLSTGTDFSWHGDFWNGWNAQAQNALVSRCLNTPFHCGATYFDGEDTIFSPEGWAIDMSKY